MKQNKNVNYKARLWVDEKGELHALSFANQQIPYGLFDALNKAIHEVVGSFNGKNDWKENYIKFTDNGKRYEQFDGKDANSPCTDCVSVVNVASIHTILMVQRGIVESHTER